MVNIKIGPDENNWILLVDNKVSCVLGDLRSAIFIEDREEPTRTSEEFINEMIEEINNRQKYPEEYDESQRLKYPVDTKELYEQLKVELLAIYYFYLV